MFMSYLSKEASLAFQYNCKPEFKVQFEHESEDKFSFCSSSFLFFT